MIIAVTGGREYTDKENVERTLDSLRIKPIVLIEGGAEGADRLARNWAKKRGIHVATVDALWDYYDRSAGSIRNKAMAALRPDMLVPFPGGTGTNNMIKICKQLNIPIYSHQYRQDRFNFLIG